MANQQDFRTTIGGKELVVSFPNLAEQANGSAVVQYGETLVMATAVMSGPKEDLGFFPLTVEYEEKFYAAGKILGSRFVRREGRPSDEAVITARVVDRAIRPLFPMELNREVQVISTCLSWDAENDPDVLALIAASCALSVSNIPWNGPVSVVRIGRIEGAFIINPSYAERGQSDLDFIVAAAHDGKQLLFNMVEAEGDETSEDVYEAALSFATPFLEQIISFQNDIRNAVGKEKFHLQTPDKNEEATKLLEDFAKSKLEEALFRGDKMDRMARLEALKTEAKAMLAEKLPGKEKLASAFFEQAIDRLMREKGIKEGLRVDGRAPNELRELNGSVGILPRTHGSAIFTRGQTKTLSILTLGTPGDQKLMEGMEFIGKKRFMHHYNFPPYSVGEVKPLRGPGRREIGHGMLAEKALLPVIPTPDKFPYTIRIVTEVLSSNGSSSMASACSSSLALMDAGVPITRPVAGIAMGLLTDETTQTYRILTDIQGPEDHYGDMDFKVAGTKVGITAIQLDVKIRGITAQMFKETLQGAHAARHAILDDVISRVLPEPRTELSKWAPRIYTIQINKEKIGELIGPGGKMIRQITEECGVEIDIEDSGQVFVTATNQESAQKALDWIRGIVKEVAVGEFYQGKVKRIMAFGAFVEIAPNLEGLVHISQLADKRVEKVEDVVNVGDSIPVKVIEIDDLGRINLSLKEALKDQHHE